MIKIFIEGLLLQASLIFALGAQNIFVLNAGIRHERHLLVALISSVCDMLLIVVGVFGIATFFVQIPLLKICFGVLGVVFLLYYGVLKIRESKTHIVLTENNYQQITLKQTILTTMAFSLFNPHVYLDTIVLIGGYSSKFNLISERLCFGVGAFTFSYIWFFCLVLLASKGKRFIRNRSAMRNVSLVSGLILVWLSFKLALDVWNWIQ